MYNNNNNKSQQYLFEKIAGDQKGQTALHTGSQGESSFLAADRPFIFFSETSINAKQLRGYPYSLLLLQKTHFPDNRVFV